MGFGATGRCYPPPMLSGSSSGGYGVAAPRILIVDDDPDLLVLLADQLRADGYEITTARDGVEASRRLETAWPDLLIIDMMMPRRDGLSLAREIKAMADLPIIVLSAIDAGDSKADLLDEVAEDYVTKPYHYPELRARINRVLRRLGDKVPRRSLILGPALTLDLHRREATVGGETVVKLTPTESRLLYALAANLGKTVSTDTLLVRGWAETEDADPSYVWVTMRRLRQKLEVDPNRPVHLLTVRGVGYRLVAADRRRGRGTLGSRAAVADRRCSTTPADDGRRSASASTAADRAEGSRFAFRTRLTIALIARRDPAARRLRHPAPDRSATAASRRTRTSGRLLLFALAIVVTLAIIASYLLVADLTAPLRSIARGRRPGLGGRPVDPDPRRRRRRARPPRREPQPARRRPRAAQPGAGPDPRGHRGGLATRRRRLPGRARGRGRQGGVRDDRCRDLHRRPIGHPDPGHRPRRVAAAPGRPARRRRRPRRAVRPAARPPGAGNAPTRTCSTCSRSHVAVAVRNAQLFAQVEAQNAQLLELDAAKDDFLRGVSHNLQTPLTSIRAHADQLGERPPGPSARDHRRAVRAAVADGPPAADRDSAGVGSLPPDGPRSSRWRSRVRKAWEALGVDDVEFNIDDQTEGWLAIADADQLDQVLWALLDNAVKYGERRPVERGSWRSTRAASAPAGHDHRRRARVSGRPIGTGCSAGSSAAPR